LLVGFNPGIHLRPAQKISSNQPARKTDFVEQIQQIHPTGKSLEKSVKSSSEKYSDFQKSQISLYPSHPVPSGGALRNVNNAGRGCGGRGWRS
jgi:hypothetical protein